MKDFTQTTDDEKTAILNKEIAGLREENKALQLALFKERKNNNTEILKSKIRKPYNPDIIDAFLDKHIWCRTSKYNAS